MIEYLTKIIFCAVIYMPKMAKDKSGGKII